MAKVGLVMGSDSDLAVLEETASVMEKFGIDYDLQVISAHRTPEKARNYALNAESKGIQIIIAAAGLAAHLAGFMAAHTCLPVIGVPVASGPLQGTDSLYSTVQMPPGVPVATVGINGGRNAGLLACQILSLNDASLRKNLQEHREEMVEGVAEKNKKVQEHFRT